MPKPPTLRQWKRRAAPTPTPLMASPAKVAPAPDAVPIVPQPQPPRRVSAAAAAAGVSRAPLTEDDVKPMVAALNSTVQTFGGRPADAVDAWARSFGLNSDAAKESDNDDEHRNLPVAVVLGLVGALAADVARLQKLARWGLAARMLGGLLVSYTPVGFLQSSGSDRTQRISQPRPRRSFSRSALRCFDRDMISDVAVAFHFLATPGLESWAS